MPTISQLPASSTVGASDLFAIVQSGTTKKATGSEVLTFVTSGLALGTAAFVNVPISPANGGTGVASPTVHTLPIAEGSAGFNFVGPLTNGQLLIGSTGADPVAAKITAGTNVIISNSAGGIAISASGSGGFSWDEVTGTSQLMVSNDGYVANNAGLVTLTLPTVSVLGDELSIIGKGAGGWLIAQNAGQSIVFGADTTTVGVGGSLASTQAADSIYLVCTTANTVWTVAVGPQGNITVV
jgi:hypothetical protein